MHRYICKCWKLTNTLVVYEDVPSATIIHRPIHPLIVLFISGLIEGATKSMTSTVSSSIFFYNIITQQSIKFSYESIECSYHSIGISFHSIGISYRSIQPLRFSFLLSNIAYQNIHKHSIHDDFNWVLNFFLKRIIIHIADSWQTLSSYNFTSKYLELLSLWGRYCSNFLTYHTLQHIMKIAYHSIA